MPFPAPARPPAPHRLRLQAALAGGVCALALLIVGLHLALLNSGQWQADEFFNFAMYREHGLRFLFGRMTGWSPRPLSETALYLYARATLALHRPLIAPMLAASWLALFGPVLAAWRGTGWMPACALCAMFLLGHRVSEMFYWPMAAVPYLACLGAIAFAVLRLVQGAPGRTPVLVALIAAAGCAELGIMFVLCLCPLLLLADLAARTPRRAAIWTIPALLCLPLIAGLLAGRVDQPGNADQTASPAFHHLGPSLRAAIAFVPTDLTAGGAWSAMIALALFGAGLFLWFSPTPRPRSLPLLAVAAALIGAAALSILAAEYQLGGPCCERHATFRQCLLALLVIVIARLAANHAPARTGVAPILAPVLLASAMLAGLLPRLGALRHDIRQQPAILAARAATWASGTTNAAQPVTFRLAPAGRMIRAGLEIAPGSYAAGPTQPWYLWGMAHYFGRSAVIVLPLAP